MKVALYARVSTKGQADKDLSIPDQVRQLREYCSKKGYEIAQEYREEGASATDAKRPVFKEMIELALQKTPPFNEILVLTTSRFFRDATGARVYKHKLRKNGVKVVAITQEVSDDPTGMLVEGFFELIDQYESQMNGFHTLRGMKENARRGYYNGSTPKYGFRVKKVQDEKGNPKSKLEINHQEAEIIRKIHRWYLEGLGLKEIVKRLNAMEMYNRKGKPWATNRIIEKIGDPCYVGDYIFNKEDKRNNIVKDPSEWIIIKVKPIINEITHKKVVELKRERNPKINHPAILTSPNFLTGFLQCGKCGAIMTLETAKSGKYRYYNCRDFLRKGPTVCSGQRVKQEVFDELIKTYLAKKLFTKKRVRKILDDFTGSYKVIVKQNDELREDLLKEKKEIEAKLDQYFTVIEKGLLEVEDLGDRLKELNNRKKVLAGKLSRIPTIKNLPPYFYTDATLGRFQKGLKEMILSPNITIARSYMKMLDAKVVLEGEKVRITGKKSQIINMLANGKVGTEVPTVVTNWLPGSATHCETPAWWQEFNIYQDRRNRKQFIGIGKPPKTPEKIYDSPLREAKRYERLLSEPFINSQADIAKELGITRTRVNQVMGLLNLPQKIQKVLLGLEDQKVIRYFSERRLRPLLAITDPAKQMQEFNRMLEKVQPASLASSGKSGRRARQSSAVVLQE